MIIYSVLGSKRLEVGCFIDSNKKCSWRNFCEWKIFCNFGTKTFANAKIGIFKDRNFAKKVKNC